MNQINECSDNGQEVILNNKVTIWWDKQTKREYMTDSSAFLAILSIGRGTAASGGGDARTCQRSLAPLASDV